MKNIIFGLLAVGMGLALCSSPAAAAKTDHYDHDIVKIANQNTVLAVVELTPISEFTYELNSFGTFAIEYHVPARPSYFVVIRTIGKPDSKRHIPWQFMQPKLC